MSGAGPVLSIRPAAVEDCACILRFVRQLAAYEREPDAVHATEAGLRAQLFGAQPRAEVLIAELDGEPSGFALFFHNFSTWTGKPGLYLEDLYVEERARGHGLGKALMVELARIAAERGCARFEWSVLDWNRPAIDFYRALGARGMDEWTVQRVEGAALARLARGLPDEPVL